MDLKYSIEIRKCQISIISYQSYEYILLDMHILKFHKLINMHRWVSTVAILGGKHFFGFHLKNNQDNIDTNDCHVWATIPNKNSFSVVLT